MSVVDSIVDLKEMAPFVRFERKPIEDKAESERQGRYVAKDVDFALVTAPYSKDIFKQKAKDWFATIKQDMQNGRFPQEWYEKFEKQYEAFKNGQEMPVEGTAIRGWGVISPAQQEELIRMNILTVELLSNINDEGVKRIGMGAVDLKTKAKAWLAQLNDKGPLTLKVAATEKENAILKSSVETLQKQVESLMAALRVEKPVSHETAEITADDLIDDDDIVEQYKAKFGKAPHHKMKPETIREALK